MAPIVNGEASSSSAFLSHLFSYPVISDSISTFKSNPYGAKSLDLTSTTYEKLGKPLLPYFSKPYEYVSPYVKKADSLGDSTLSTIDSRFPVVKKPTSDLYNEGKSLFFFPLTKGAEGKDYVLKTYNTEVKNVGGDGVFTYGKAAIGTGLRVGGDVYKWAAGLVGAKKAEAKEVANEKLNH